MKEDRGMAKRKDDSDDESPHRKRQKITKDLASKAEIQTVQTSKDLSLLLSFEQDAGPRTRQKIESFKLFLSSIAYGKESDDRSAKRELLLEYLRSQPPSDNEANSTYLTDIIKTWHFSAQSNVENLFSSVAAVLALLLKSIASLVDFREWGNHLCRTLLHDDQVKLFDRGLSVNKAKEYVVTPCLRLLTEIVSFDGGHATRSLFRQREITFKRLEIFLGVRKNAQGDEPKSRKGLSLRECALRYLHANLRLQGPTAKMYILAQGRVVRAWLEDIAEDPPDIVLGLLEVLKENVASDSAISLVAKSRFFNEWVLGRLATLYSYKEASGVSKGHRSVQKTVHEFLLFICTSPGFGVLDPRNEGRPDVSRSRIDMYAVSTQDFFRSNKSYGDDQTIIGNGKLSSFLQTLRPHANVAQSDLVIAVFRKTPELVSDYFLRRKAFSFDPKATATWVGYSAFLLATVQIPLPETLRPESFNDAVPSLYDKIIESIIPHPLTKKVMTRCLNQSSDLVKFLATRILTAAFEKFARLLRICREMQACAIEKDCAAAWSQLTSYLTNEFCERVPDIESVISQFRSCPKDNVMLLESITRLLALFYEVLPQPALDQKFDISVALLAALDSQDTHAEGHGEIGMLLLELEHLLTIARHSPTMQWFHKPASMQLSPFTMLLKMHRNESRAGSGSQKYSEVVESIAIENQILYSRHSLNALNLSLQDFGSWKASDNVFEFLDNCILRLVRSLIHYYDLASSLVFSKENRVDSSDIKIDLLLVAVMEQWPFLAKSVDSATLQNVSLWLIRYVTAVKLTLSYDGGDVHGSGTADLLSQVKSQIRTKTEDKSCRRIFRSGWEAPLEFGISEQTLEVAAANNEERVRELDTRTQPVSPEISASLLPSSPPQEDEDHPELNRWSREDIGDAISEGAIGDLYLCLCSQYVEIRKQALSSIEALMRKLENAGYHEWLQIYMLTGELAETARAVIADGPLPYFPGTLAAQLLLVQVDPLHFMYVKANKFLNKGPQWNVKKLPSYWVEKTLLNPPTEDEAYYQEVAWLLDILVDGLRTPADMEIYRHCNILERLLSLCATPSFPEPCFEKILDLLFRCTYVEGSTTLITRCAVISWIVSRLTQKGTGEWGKARLRALASRLYETCDRGYVNDWSDGTLSSTLDNLRLSKE